MMLVDEIELKYGVDDAADTLLLLRKYVDSPGNTLTTRVRRKCVDFNVRTLLVSNARLSTALKAWPIQLYFGVLGLVLVCYSLISVHSSLQSSSLLSTFKIVTRQKVVGVNCDCAHTPTNTPHHSATKLAP